ncbi:MAG: hypothetical protein WCF23_15015 [Candidatus Nitrosopolaris sp.]
MNRMALACFAGVAAFACGLVALNWYKSRRPEYRKRVRKLVAEDIKEAVAEQLA